MSYAKLLRLPGIKRSTTILQGTARLRGIEGQGRALPLQVPHFTSSILPVLVNPFDLNE